MGTVIPGQMSSGALSHNTYGPNVKPPSSSNHRRVTCPERDSSGGTVSNVAKYELATTEWLCLGSADLVRRGRRCRREDGNSFHDFDVPSQLVIFAEYSQW